MLLKVAECETNKSLISGDGLYISVALTVRSCTICVVFTYVFFFNKYCLNQNLNGIVPPLGYNDSFMKPFRFCAV